MTAGHSGNLIDRLMKLEARVVELEATVGTPAPGRAEAPAAVPLSVPVPAAPASGWPPLAEWDSRPITPGP